MSRHYSSCESKGKTDDKLGSLRGLFKRIQKWLFSPTGTVSRMGVWAQWPTKTFGIRSRSRVIERLIGVASCWFTGWGRLIGLGNTRESLGRLVQSLSRTTGLPYGNIRNRTKISWVRENQLFVDKERGRCVKTVQGQPE
ncbi:hypothetical protein CABS02_15292 [Colletotrichum abscissum]|uniref:Uncharacterized protein n=1 Tax=Colletotrichum abscissum TaxID=1671311 RepID=A0A9P9X027_9PEZI|nr:hypothetical protein CABS02_15292 [Colletotrichum abscissum]